MEGLEPKKKFNILNKEFLAKYAYIFVLAVLLIGGISFSYTFFTQNRKIASGSITTANLSINFGNRNINATNLSVPATDQEGLSEFVKGLTITNSANTDGRVVLSLTRTSGLNLDDLRYAIIVNGAIQEVDDVPNDGVILRTAIMGNETMNVEVRLWPKTSYIGSETTFVGELTKETSFLGNVGANKSNITGKYVKFNCDGTNCEVWQIVKVENGRLVLTRQSDYANATSRTNSNRYNSSLTFNDNSMITSVSTDDLNVYLAKTVKINGGIGTQSNPYTLINNDFREEDKKVIAQITYKDNNNTTMGTQNIYYNETNYISQEMNNPTFQGWSDGLSNYVLGDTITFTSDTDLEALVGLTSTLSITNNSVSLALGTNGENPYTYNGDGALSCLSSDDTKVTCSIDTVNNKIVLVPVALTTADVTITVSGVDGINYSAPTAQTFTVTVKNPTTLSLSPTSGTILESGSDTSTITTDGDGALSCSSSDDTIATCIVSGNTLTITGVTAGSATITVIQSEGTNYSTASATYEVTINSN